ncbi:MAG: peptidoglycan editing factor PgeF [Saprospiraceae bacterium]|nr:peptidoglycan editing factor PgeF [Saprospiraceae bacterium]
MIIHAPFSSDQLVACESTRMHGVSEAPFDTRNLGIFTADDPASVQENLRIHCGEIGLGPDQLALTRQVHGDQILVVQAPGRYEGFDALITDRKGIYLGIGTADCCSILIHDPVRNAVGAVHAGWRGAALQILPKTIMHMREHFQSDPADLWVYLGTSIGWTRYEVGEEVADQFPDVFLRPGKAEGKFFLDVKGFVFAQALACGILNEHVTGSSHCTYDEPELFYSFRRDGDQSGRMLSLIGMRS